MQKEKMNRSHQPNHRLVGGSCVNTLSCEQSRNRLRPLVVLHRRETVQGRAEWAGASTHAFCEYSGRGRVTVGATRIGTETDYGRAD